MTPKRYDTEVYRREREAIHRALDAQEQAQTPQEIEAAEELLREARREMTRKIVANHDQGD